MAGSTGRGYVIHVEVVWEDKHLNFLLKRQTLPTGSVTTKVKEVMVEVQRSLALTVARHMTDFALPLSQNFVQARFRAGAIQLPPGQSVVITNLGTRKVYKHCLINTEGAIATTAFCSQAWKKCLPRVSGRRFCSDS